MNNLWTAWWSTWKCARNCKWQQNWTGRHCTVSSVQYIVSYQIISSCLLSLCVGGDQWATFSLFHPVTSVTSRLYLFVCLALFSFLNSPLLRHKKRCFSRKESSILWRSKIRPPVPCRQRVQVNTALLSAFRLLLAIKTFSFLSLDCFVFQELINRSSFRTLKAITANIESKKTEKFNVQYKNRKIYQPSNNPPDSIYDKSIVMIHSIYRRKGREVSKFVYSEINCINGMFLHF